MVSEDFKLNLYFKIYKDYPIASRDSFREMFIKKNGKFHYLPELILMIEQYQKEKFGGVIWNCKNLYAPSKNKHKKGKMF